MHCVTVTSPDRPPGELRRVAAELEAIGLFHPCSDRREEIVAVADMRSRGRGDDLAMHVTTCIACATALDTLERRRATASWGSPGGALEVIEGRESFRAVMPSRSTALNWAARLTRFARGLRTALGYARPLLGAGVVLLAVVGAVALALNFVVGSRPSHGAASPSAHAAVAGRGGAGHAAAPRAAARPTSTHRHRILGDRASVRRARPPRAAQRPAHVVASGHGAAPALRSAPVSRAVGAPVRPPAPVPAPVRPPVAAPRAPASPSPPGGWSGDFAP
jgi:hypothetical protein